MLWYVPLATRIYTLTHSFQLRSHMVHCGCIASEIISACVCVCVCERERERGRENSVALNNAFKRPFGQSDVLNWQQRKKHENNCRICICGLSMMLGSWIMNKDWWIIVSVCSSASTWANIRWCSEWSADQCHKSSFKPSGHNTE